MYEDVFINRMKNWVAEEKTGKHEPEIGPVITISREYGCYAEEIAEELAERLNKEYVKNGPKWDTISNEVLEHSANLLKVEPEEISHIFGANEKTLVQDIVDAFTDHKKYASDTAIKKAIGKVVKCFAEKGHNIIVGRAGYIIAEHIPKAVHVKIIAPKQIRVKEIQERFKISRQEAIKKVDDIDKKREKFMSFYQGNKSDSEVFDLILNKSRLKIKSIVSLIVQLAKMRGVV